jgi:hypothetical protein
VETTDTLSPRELQVPVLETPPVWMILTTTLRPPSGFVDFRVTVLWSQ